MGRNTRTRTPHGRRIALSCGTAAGAALIAASISMGNAPAAGAVVDADPLTDLIGAFDPNAFSPSDAPTDALGLLGYYTDFYLLGPTGLGSALDPMVDSWLTPSTSAGAATLDALPAAGVSNTLALSYLIEAFDPNSFNAAGTPTDTLGLLGYYTDTYLLGPTGLDAELAPLVQELVGTVTVGSPPTYTAAISELIGAFDPNAFSATGVPLDTLGLLGYYTDFYLLGPTGIDNLLAPYVADIIASLPSSAASVDVDPVSDLVAALDPSAFSAGVADLAAPTTVDALAPVIDGLLGSGLSLF
jgi:hypothetical protein